MKQALLLLCLVIYFAASAQIDTLTIDGVSTPGKLREIYKDRVIFKVGKQEYSVMKKRITGMNVRFQEKLPSGEVGWKYNNELYKIMGSDWSEYKNTKYYLVQAGTFAITGTCLSIFGGVLSGIGAVNNDQKLVLTGSLIGATGICLQIPMGVYLFKAGHAKDYEEY